MQSASSTTSSTSTAADDQDAAKNIDLVRRRRSTQKKKKEKKTSIDREDSTTYTLRIQLRFDDFSLRILSRRMRIQPCSKYSSGLLSVWSTIKNCPKNKEPTILLADTSKISRRTRSTRDSGIHFPQQAKGVVVSPKLCASCCD
jgi:hypothetical protein